MATDEATVKEFDDGTKELGDQLVGLTLLQAKSLADYLKDVHGIEPAGGGVVMAVVVVGQRTAATAGRAGAEARTQSARQTTYQKTEAREIWWERT